VNIVLGVEVCEVENREMLVLFDAAFTTSIVFAAL
jgi:hypothetical protein